MRAGVHPVLPESCSRIGLRRTSGALTPEKRPQAALTWVNHADLYRIKGVAGQYAELLEVAGVDTVPELARRSAFGSGRPHRCRTWSRSACLGPGADRGFFRDVVGSSE
jgi:hypothetical protein